MAPHFFPPMWEQRRISIARVLYDYGAQSVLEVGCGEGNVLAFLAAPAPDGRRPITRLYGVDIRKASLEAARSRLAPDAHDYRSMRTDELRIELYHGDAAVRIGSVSADAIVCSEVIEHVDELSGVPALTGAILGAYRPRLAIFTTPNAEFNINFAPLNYGKPDARFRDDDHKFEWTRAQFAAWAEQAAMRFGYTVELLPVGAKMRNAGADFVACGGCTQMAVFERTPGDEPAADALAEAACNVPVLLATIEYPTYNRLLELVLGAVRSMGGSSSSFTTEDLWAVPEVKRQFRLQSSLETWLRASSAHASSALGRTRTGDGTIVYSISQLSAIAPLGK